MSKAITQDIIETSADVKHSRLPFGYESDMFCGVKIPEIMTPQWIEKAIHNIPYRNLKGEPVYDDSACHYKEDQLWEIVFIHIAHNKCDNPALCAKMVLKTREMDFSRAHE